MFTHDMRWPGASAVRWRRLAVAAAASILLLTASVSAQVEPGQSRPVLTNQDVITMTRAGQADPAIIAAIDAAGADFDLSPGAVSALEEAGVAWSVITAMRARSRPPASPDPDTLKRTFKTMVVDASRAGYFKTPTMKAALASDPGFADLGITMVDQGAADTVLEVEYKLAWDYPFKLRDWATGALLLQGKGTGPFSGLVGARSVAHEFVALLRPDRPASAGAGPGEGLTALVSSLVAPGDIVSVTRWPTGSVRGTVERVTPCTLEVHTGTSVEPLSLWDIRTLKRRTRSAPPHPGATSIYELGASCDDISCVPAALIFLGIGGLVQVFETNAPPPEVVVYRSAQRRDPPETCRAR